MTEGEEDDLGPGILTGFDFSVAEDFVDDVRISEGSVCIMPSGSIFQVLVGARDRWVCAHVAIYRSTRERVYLLRLYYFFVSSRDVYLALRAPCGFV